MIFTRKNRYTEITFEDNENIAFINKYEEKLGKFTGVREPGYEKSRAYKSGYWDGYTLLYDKSNHRLPDGLFDQLVEFSETIKEQVSGYSYKVVDDREELFMGEEDVPQDMTFKDGDNEYTLFDYQYNSVKSAIGSGKGILHLATNAGKTGVSVSLIKTLSKYLERGEKVIYFVPSKAIFEQAIKTMQENFGKNAVGYIGDGKKKVSTINVVIMLSMVSALKDPTKGKDVKVTGKARTLQIFIDEVAPLFENANQKSILSNLVKSYKPTTKARTEILDWLKKADEECPTDNRVKLYINSKKAEYRKLMQGKVGTKYKKYEDTLKLVSETKIVLVDEGHHSKSDTTFDTLLRFTNAPYMYAMTGSIDTKDKLSSQRLKGLYHKVIYTVSNDELIERGISAKPTINLIKVKGNIGLTSEEDKNYMAVYEKGIVKYDARNDLIVGLTKKMIEKGKTSLLIVNRVEHGEILKEKLDSVGVKSKFISGDTSTEDREIAKKEAKDGTLKVLIATSIFDEGVSINNIDVLFMVSSTKSLRLILQRVGRVLRKKSGDNKALVFDFIDMTHIFLKNHAKDRIKIYKDQNFDIKYLN